MVVLNKMKTKKYIIKSKIQFDYLINIMCEKYYFINFTGFYSKRMIYINVEDNSKEHKPFLIIFDVSNMNKDSYIKCLRVVKRLFI